MGMWIEIRCERRVEEASYGLQGGGRCLSHDNVGPMGEAHDTRADVSALIQELEGQARNDGWVKTRKGWVCPRCYSRAEKMIDDTARESKNE